MDSVDFTKTGALIGMFSGIEGVTKTVPNKRSRSITVYFTSKMDQSICFTLNCKDCPSSIHVTATDEDDDDEELLDKAYSNVTPRDALLEAIHGLLF